MPANLTPDYLAAEEEFKSAQSHDEKLAALERMLATIPKHKGTEKLQADIKRRLARLRKESQKKGTSHAAPFWLVRREGAGQVALVGPPNAGKSSLVARLTHAHAEVAAYPFTTRAPMPGMMNYEDVQIQLLDLPPVSSEFMERWLPQVIRMANLGVLVVGLDDPSVLEDIDFILQTLVEHRTPVPELMLCNKIDLPGTADTLAALEDLYGPRFRYLPVSAATGANLDRFAREAFAALGIVRMYSKPPGKPADLSRPYILRRGQTVQDAAKQVHKDFADNLRFARLYRESSAHSGMMVERTHVVEDRDILEFHI
ncbi:MAG: 50S ribosome-binding GTPase [Bryobacteraceae bacterium]|nr:50S ribosome-binding GTPase [Bryobacteraceae bacterium]